MEENGRAIDHSENARRRSETRALWSLSGSYLDGSKTARRSNGTAFVAGTVVPYGAKYPFMSRIICVGSGTKMLVAASVPETMAAFATSACAMRAPDLR